MVVHLPVLRQRIPEFASAVRRAREFGGRRRTWHSRCLHAHGEGPTAPSSVAAVVAVAQRANRRSCSASWRFLRLSWIYARLIEG